MKALSVLGLLRAETRRLLIITFRYPVEAASSLILSTLVFLGIFFGATQLGVTGIGSTYSLGGLVISYFAWLLLTSAVSQPSSDVESEAARGSILGLYMSSSGLTVVLACRAIAMALITAVQSLLVLIVLVAVTGAELRWTFLAIPSLLLLFVSGLGFGFLLAAFTLRLKRTQVLFAPVYLLLLPVTFLSVDRYGELARLLFFCLPATPAATMLRLQMTGFTAEPSLLAVAVLNALAYSVLGALAIRAAVRKTVALGIAVHA
jgi:ABC-type polysaccharide/polyol phosphate export permease